MSVWTPYHRESAMKAMELCKGITSPAEKYRVITEWVTRNFSYDYIRAITISKKNGRPDIPRTWQRRMGICMDVSSMVVNMMRAVGLKAYFCIGSADNSRNHAWVEVVIGGELLRYDHSNVNKTKVRQYTVRSRY